MAAPRFYSPTTRSRKPRLMTTKTELFAERIFRPLPRDDVFFALQPGVREAAEVVLAEAQLGDTNFVRWLDRLLTNCVHDSAHPLAWIPDLNAIHEGPKPRYNGFARQRYERVPLIDRREHTAYTLRFIAELGAERAAARAMTEAEASADLHSLVNDLANRFPQLGLSFGYIGNCSLFVQPGNPNYYDDRSWRVFSKLANQRGLGGTNISFGSHPTSDLGYLLLDARYHLADWCAATAKRLEAGELFSLAERPAEAASHG